MCVKHKNQGIVTNMASAIKKVPGQSIIYVLNDDEVQSQSKLLKQIQFYLERFPVNNPIFFFNE